MNHEALRNSTAPVIPASPSRPTASSIGVAVLRRGEEPARVLEQDRAELAGVLERLEPVREPGPDVVAQLVRQVLRVDARLLGQLRRERLAQVLREPLRLRRLPGHQRVRLDVEHEVRRRPLDPQLRGPTRRAARSRSRPPRRAGTGSRSSRAAPRPCRRRRGRRRRRRSSSGRSTTPCRGGPCRSPTRSGSAATSGGQAVDAVARERRAPGRGPGSRSGASVRTSAGDALGMPLWCRVDSGRALPGGGPARVAGRAAGRRGGRPRGSGRSSGRCRRPRASRGPGSRCRGRGGSRPARSARRAARAASAGWFGARPGARSVLTSGGRPGAIRSSGTQWPTIEAAAPRGCRTPAEAAWPHGTRRG